MAEVKTAEQLLAKALVVIETLRAVNSKAISRDLNKAVTDTVGEIKAFVNTKKPSATAVARDMFGEIHANYMKTKQQRDALVRNKRALALEQLQCDLLARQRPALTEGPVKTNIIAPAGNKAPSQKPPPPPRPTKE
jgi:hypothetical protein